MDKHLKIVMKRQSLITSNILPNNTLFFAPSGSCNVRFKGTVNVIYINPSFKVWHVRFTTVHAFKPLSDHYWEKYSNVFKVDMYIFEIKDGESINITC